LKKPPVDSSFPINDFSLTITRAVADIPLLYLEIIYEFYTKYTLKGGVSTEVGSRAFQLHLQGAFRMRYPTHKMYMNELTKMIRKLLPQSGFRIKVLVKPFGLLQSFTPMIGYITKDQG
jgi:hypothetical protein